MPGTFVGLKLHWFSARAINDCLQPLGILKEPLDELHVTLLYALNEIPGFVPRGRNMLPITIGPNNMRWALFGPQRNVLVLRLFNSAFERRHYQLLGLGFQPKPDPYLQSAYSPHITLDKNYGGNFNTLSRIKMVPLTFDCEYAEPLNK